MLLALTLSVGLTGCFERQQIESINLCIARQRPVVLDAYHLCTIEHAPATCMDETVLRQRDYLVGGCTRVEWRIVTDGCGDVRVEVARVR